MSLGRNSKEIIPTRTSPFTAHSPPANSLSVYLLAIPLVRPPLPILQLHYPLPPPLLTGAPLFIPALRNLRTPHLLPDVPEGGLVAFVTSESGEEVRYVGVGRVVAKGGMRGARERRVSKLGKGAEEDEGRFCEVLCIIGDQ